MPLSTAVLNNSHGPTKRSWHSPFSWFHSSAFSQPLTSTNWLPNTSSPKLNSPDGRNGCQWVFHELPVFQPEMPPCGHESEKNFQMLSQTAVPPSDCGKATG